jgi:hypothetical protein
MAGKALIRLLLILTLILAAHSLKPISGSNFAEQVLGAAESLSVILPDATATRFVQANLLAAVFGRSLSPEPVINPTEGVLLASNAVPTRSVIKPMKNGLRALVGRTTATVKSASIKTRLKPIILPAAFPVERALAMSFAIAEASYTPMLWAKRFKMPRFNIRPVRAVLMPKGKSATCDPEKTPGKPVETIISTDVAPIEAELFLSEEAISFSFDLFSSEEATEAVATTPPVQECENEPREVLFEPLMPVIPMH